MNEIDISLGDIERIGIDSRTGKRVIYLREAKIGVVGT